MIIIAGEEIFLYLKSLPDWLTHKTLLIPTILCNNLN